MDKFEYYTNGNEQKKQFNEAIDTSIRFIPLGGGNEASCSSFLFSFDDIHILVDCGVRYNSERRYPDYSFLTRLLGSWNKLSAVLVTYSHMDHCGSILRIFQELPPQKVNMTNATQEILMRLFRYQLKFESETIDDETSKNEIRNIKSDMFDEKINDVTLFDFFEPLNFKSAKTNKILEIVPFPSGHMLGSSGFIMKYQGKEIFFTSDYQPRQQYSVDVKPFFPDLKSLDCLILDGTNFYNLDKTLPSEIKEQEKHVLNHVKTAIDENKFIIFPVNSTGHAQEVIKILDNAMLEKTIKSVPIYIDGSANIIQRIYEKHYSLQDKAFTSSNVTQLDKNLQIQDILFSCCIIISTPKNFLIPKSRTFEYVTFLIDNDLPHLVMSLFDPATPHSTRISEETEDILLNLNIVPYRLETHISAQDIIKLLKKTNPKKVILVHSPTRRDISDTFKEIHPLDFPRNISITQSINNMPFYI